jgi:hypothetical protein
MGLEIESIAALGRDSWPHYHIPGHAGPPCGASVGSAEFTVPNVRATRRTQTLARFLNSRVLVWRKES